MSVRELVVLGTASQVPTRDRNHNGYLLRWDAEGLLFDPGEGTQRQLTLAGVAASSITRILITHLHGDHCLGLPGIAQRLALDGATHPVDLYFPAAGLGFVERLLTATEHRRPVALRLHPCGPGEVAETSGFRLLAERLDHGVETLGWRLEEPTGRRFLPDRLAALGIAGAAVGELARRGRIDRNGHTVTLDEVSVERPGQRAAVVMDTRWCDGALTLADGADLLLCESTFLDADADLADTYRHLTAAQAGRLAAEAGARRLVLAHYSQRYPDVAEFAAEAGAVHPDTVAARDLDRVAVPARRSGPG